MKKVLLMMIMFCSMVFSGTTLFTEEERMTIAPAVRIPVAVIQVAIQVPAAIRAIAAIQAAMILEQPFKQ